MSKLHRAAAAAFLFTLALSAPCAADTITFGTGMNTPGTIEGNNYTGFNHTVTPDPSYAPAFAGTVWESATTDGGTGLWLGALIGYWFNVVLPSDAVNITGALGVLWDDSGRLTVNAFEITNNIGAPQGEYCASTVPTCTRPSTWDISSALQPGMNWVIAYVSQDVAYTPSGLDLIGIINFDHAQDPQSPVPEPATWIMTVGCCLVMLSIRRAVR